MKKLRFITAFIAFAVLGCATVKVQAPKEPIKLDVTMRLDVYQHVQKDISAVEDIVTGSDKGGKPESMINFLVRDAYAQELSPETEQAALRRKARYNELSYIEGSGKVGEDNSGLVSLRTPSESSVEDLVNEENRDRMIIYREIAEKNGVSVEEIRAIYTERLQKDAPSGTPVQKKDGSWQVK